MTKTALCAILFGLACAASGHPQELPAPKLAALPDQPAFTISRQVDEVNLILSVTDSKGRFVGDLTADDLKVLDNHQPPAKWNYFQVRTNVPLRVVLAVDVSSSVRDRFRFEQRAASSFLKRVLRKDTDEAAIVAFGDDAQEKSAGMTTDTGQLDTTIRALQPGGETAMYDAVVLASQEPG
jgi:VWFA-related protein